MDITKCNSTTCPLRDSCKRYTIESTEYQSWFQAAPYKDGSCEYYLPNKSLEENDNRL